MRKNKFVSAGGQASICTWGLSFTFRTREQCKIFIDKMFALEWNTIPKFEYEEQPHEYYFCVTISEFSWAHNLKTIAELLEEVDCSFE